MTRRPSFDAFVDEEAELRAELGAPPVMSRVVRSSWRRSSSTTCSAVSLRHRLPPVGAGIDVAMRAGLVAELSDVDLQHFDSWRSPEAVGRAPEDLVERRRAGACERPFVARPSRPGDGELTGGTARPYIPTFCAMFRICTPWTREAPPRIARRDVDGLGHLIEVGPFLEAGVRVGVDAVRGIESCARRPGR